MSIIVSNLSSDKRIIMGQDWCGRSAPCLSRSWVKVRIGIRFCTADSGTNVTTASFRVGLAAGASFYGQGGSNPTHEALFLVTGNSSTWNRTNAATPYYNSAFSAGEGYANGVGYTGSAADIEDGTGVFFASDTNRSCIFFEFTKGTPWTMRYFRNTSGSPTDVSDSTFLSQLQAVNPSIANHSFNGGSTMTVNEATYGYFTHVALHWNQTNPVLKISDVAVAVIA